MKGYALSLTEIAGRVPEEAREMISAIVQGSDRLTRLVEGLLDLSKIERGDFSMNREERDVVELVRRAVEDLGEAGRRVVLVNPGPVTCNVDPGKFVQLMLLLLENAVKFSPPGSPVEVEIVRLEAECLVSVLDRGPGIPENFREAVFERFFQVEEARYHSIPGLGAGLYIAREIVHAHRGRIWCEERAGGGSVFRFTLPFQREAEASPGGPGAQ
jgi:signal transduction histidine kinase